MKGKPISGAQVTVLDQADPDSGLAAASSSVGTSDSGKTILVVIGDGGECTSGTLEDGRRVIVCG
jgi:hypothetical protein